MGSRAKNRRPLRANPGVPEHDERQADQMEAFVSGEPVAPPALPDFDWSEDLPELPPPPDLHDRRRVEVWMYSEIWQDVQEFLDRYRTSWELDTPTMTSFVNASLEHCLGEIDANRMDGRLVWIEAFKYRQEEMRRKYQRMVAAAADSPAEEEEDEPTSQLQLDAFAAPEVLEAEAYSDPRPEVVEGPQLKRVEVMFHRNLWEDADVLRNQHKERYDTQTPTMTSFANAVTEFGIRELRRGSLAGQAILRRALQIRQEERRRQRPGSRSG